MKITIIEEFDTPSQAAEFIARVTGGIVIDTVANEVVDPATITKTTKERKPRADAGQPRGAYKPRDKEANAASAGAQSGGATPQAAPSAGSAPAPTAALAAAASTTTGGPAASEPGVGDKASASVSQPAAPATPTKSSAPQEPTSAAVGQSSPPAAAAEDFPATLDGARAAMKALDQTANKGMDACIAALKAHGVNRITDLDTAKYPEFIKFVLGQSSAEGIAKAKVWAADKAKK